MHIVKKNLITKRGHLIAHVHNKQMKSSIKPFIVRTKKVSKALRKKLVQWIMKILNVREYSIARDTLLITDAESRVKQRVTKILMLHVKVAK